MWTDIIANIGLCFIGLGTPNTDGICADWTFLQVGPVYLVDVGVEPGLADASILGFRLRLPDEDTPVDE